MSGFLSNCCVCVFVIRVGGYFEDGHEEDFDVEQEGAVIHVPVVEFDAFMPFYFLAAMNLGPARYAGANVKHMELLFGILTDWPGMIG